MKKRCLILLSFLLLLYCTGRPLHAAPEDLYWPEKRGFFLGAGFNLGGESLLIKNVATGIALYMGYRISDRLSLAFNWDTLYLRDSGKHYFLIPFTVGGVINVWKDLGIYSGFGYSLVRDPAAGAFSDGTSTKYGFFNGWHYDGGVRYEFWLQEYLSFTPQFGFLYSHVADKNILLPMLRLNVSYYFF